MAKEVKYSETGQSLLIKALGYSPKLRIIDLFLTNPFFDFSKEELAKEIITEISLQIGNREAEKRGKELKVEP